MTRRDHTGPGPATDGAMGPTGDVAAGEPADAWLAALRADEVVGQRARTSWLARQAAEEATLAGALLELAEQRALLQLSLSPDGSEQGVIVALGSNVVVLSSPSGGTTLVPLERIAVARSGAQPAGVWGDRQPVATATLRELLQAWLPERPLLTVRAGATTVHGELVAVGIDVMTLRASQGERRRSYVALSEVVVITSGEALAV